MKSWTAVDDIQKENDCSQIYMIKLCQKKKKKKEENMWMSIQTTFLVKWNQNQCAYMQISMFAIDLSKTVRMTAG